MFNIHSVEIDWGGRPLKLETGKIARQAGGAVVATYGETVVLATVVAAKTPREGVDFLGVPTEIKFEARNLTGTKYQEYQELGENRVYYNRYNVGTTLSLGASITF